MTRDGILYVPANSHASAHSFACWTAMVSRANVNYLGVYFEGCTFRPIAALNVHHGVA